MAVAAIHQLAGLGRDEFEYTQVALHIEELVNQVAQGTFDLPKECVGEVIDDLTIIQIRIKHAPENQQETVAKSISRIISYLKRNSHSTSVQDVLELVVGSDEQVVHCLWANGHIRVEMENVVLISPELARKLNNSLLEVILKNSSQHYNKMQIFNINDCLGLSSDAVGILLKYLPKFYLSNLRNLAPHFLDHTLVIEGTRFAVNKSHLMHFSPYFKSLWSGQMKEAQPDILETQLDDVDPYDFETMLYFMVETRMKISIQGCFDLLVLLDRYLMMDKKYVVQLFEQQLVKAIRKERATYTTIEAVWGLWDHLKGYSIKSDWLDVKLLVADMLQPFLLTQEQLQGLELSTISVEIKKIVDFIAEVEELDLRKKYIATAEQISVPIASFTAMRSHLKEGKISAFHFRTYLFHRKLESVFSPLWNTQSALPSVVQQKLAAFEEWLVICLYKSDLVQLLSFLGKDPMAFGFKKFYEILIKRLRNDVRLLETVCHLPLVRERIIEICLYSKPPVDQPDLLNLCEELLQDSAAPLQVGTYYLTEEQRKSILLEIEKLRKGI